MTCGEKIGISLCSFVSGTIFVLIVLVLIEIKKSSAPMYDSGPAILLLACISAFFGMIAYSIFKAS